MMGVVEKSTVLDFNVGTKMIEIFPGPSKAVLVEIGMTSRLFRFLSTKIGFLFHLSSWQLYNHVKFVKKSTIFKYINANMARNQKFANHIILKFVCHHLRPFFLNVFEMPVIL